jgi:hypothetical protein
VLSSRISLFSLWQSSETQGLFTALAALLGYGSWAAWCNHEFGALSTIKAFAAQGSFAFAATLSLTLLAASLYRRLGRTYQALTLAFICCFIISLTVPASIHWLIGTPKILASMLPGLLCGSVYLLSYLLLLHRATNSA